MTVPFTRADVRPASELSVTSNCGEEPWTWLSPRFSSPSRPKASSRIDSARSERLRSLATVKSQARKRLPRSMPDWPSLRKICSKCGRRLSTAWLFVRMSSR